MSLLQQQLAFVPIELRFQPALSCPFNGSQRTVRQGYGLFNLPCDLTRPGKEGDKGGHPQLGPGGVVSRRTAAEKRYPLRHIAILGLEPAAIDRSHRDPEWLLDRHCNQLVYPLAEDCVLSDERKRYGADCQDRSQRRRMSQSPSLSNCCSAPCRCLVRKA